MKQDKNDGNTRILNQRGKGNETELIENKVEDDGGDEGATRAPKRRKYGNWKPNTDSTNDSRYSCTNTEEDGNSTIGEDGAVNEDDGLILKEGKIVEDKEKNTEAAVASDEGEDLGAMGIDSSNSESSSNTVITLQLLEEQVRKMNTLQTKINDEWPDALNGKRMESGEQPGNIL